MRILSFVLLLFTFSVNVMAQQPKPDARYRFLGVSNPIQYKNYYALTLCEEIPALKAMLAKDTVFANFLNDRNQRISNALTACKNDINCYAEAFKFSNDDIEAVSKQFKALYKKDNELGKMIIQHLIPSGCYINYGELSPELLLAKAWEQDAKAINYAISVYVEGAKPNYPKIDSIDFNIKKDKTYPEKVITSTLIIAQSSPTLFFQPSMDFALQALDMNHRTDPADYEPMISTVNAAAIAKIKTVNWNSFPYSVLLIPGEGPEDPTIQLSAGGKLRCQLAAIQYQKKMAPFIIVSGGRVHPYKTKYSEAYEMKLYLMQKLNIPESAIIMEPHARHTTTNMRNSARLMFRYGMPMDKPALSCTLKAQNQHISNILTERSKKELGYAPFTLGKRLSDTELEFFPSLLSLQIDVDEPLDPQ
ncbi:MAG: YdcF family protein [Bacteroidota bacterium]